MADDRTTPSQDADEAAELLAFADEIDETRSKAMLSLGGLAFELPDDPDNLIHYARVHLDAQKQMLALGAAADRASEHLGSRADKLIRRATELLAARKEAPVKE